jgi:hypothetical protein
MHSLLLVLMMMATTATTTSMTTSMTMTMMMMMMMMVMMMGVASRVWRALRWEQIGGRRCRASYRGERGGRV